MDNSGPYHTDRRRIQEVINYLTSRLRAVLISLADESSGKKLWQRRTFIVELVFTLKDL